MSVVHFFEGPDICTHGLGVEAAAFRHWFLGTKRRSQRGKAWLAPCSGAVNTTGLIGERLNEFGSGSYLDVLSPSQIVRVRSCFASDIRAEVSNFGTVIIELNIPASRWRPSSVTEMAAREDIVADSSGRVGTATATQRQSRQDRGFRRRWSGVRVRHRYWRVRGRGGGCRLALGAERQAVRRGSHCCMACA